MRRLLKIVCLALYAAGLCGALGWLQGRLTDFFVAAAALFLLIHVIELPFVFGRLARYRGPWLLSLALALLFGLLHTQALGERGRGPHNP